MKEKTICSILAALFISAGTAQALPIDLDIDFRHGAWHDADDQITWTIGDITAQAQLTGSFLLFQDSTDGFGIKGGKHHKIDKSERLVIPFNTPYVRIDSYINNLFSTKNGNQLHGETGFVKLRGGDDSASWLQSFASYGNGSHKAKVKHKANGKQLVDFGKSFIVSNAVFHAIDSDNNNEFSVVGSENAAPVPEPATMLLFGIGLTGLAGIARRRMKT